jgi:hypothetical protein
MVRTGQKKIEKPLHDTRSDWKREIHIVEKVVICDSLNY